MNIHEMTPDQIRAHLKQLEREEIRALDREIMAARGALSDLERKRAALTGQEFAPTVLATQEPEEAETVRYSMDELTVLVGNALAGSQPVGIGTIADRAGISTNQARRALEHMSAAGTVTREGEKRGTTYRLATPEPEQAPAPEIDPFA